MERFREKEDVDLFCHGISRVDQRIRTGTRSVRQRIELLSLAVLQITMQHGLQVQHYILFYCA